TKINNKKTSMLIGMISDIHSNMVALSRVLEELENKNPDYILCLGDIVGYGPQPNEVCEELRERENVIAVKGNHDQAVLSGDTEKLNEAATQAVKWTREKIDENNLQFLKSLNRYEALEFEQFHVFAVHGSPRDYLNEYVYEDTPEEELEEMFEETKAHLIATGHTHIPYVREVGTRLFMNAGSVGQPRDRDRRSSYVVIDTEERSVNIQRVPYDVEETAGSIKSSRLPDSLGERLYYGR
ncbi:MAG: metallophosphoesterase, partial [Candidatus Aenigmatarchaeota archaeon]